MKRKAEFVMEKVGGEYLLVPLGAQVIDLNGIITLNATGSYVWELLAEERSADELAAAVVERFDVTRERARTDVESFLEHIGQMGILE